MAKKNKRSTKVSNAAIPAMNGQGGYYTDKVVPFMNRLVPKGTFAKVGGTGGGMLGASTALPGAGALGAYAGNYLGGKISKILGFGDYTVVSNTIAKKGMAVPEGTAVPSFGAIGHETRICHREYVRDIVVPASPTAFTNTSTPINPGNQNLFPWLAPIAANYQQYKFNGMVIEYRTLSSDITAGGALGSVILATNYDAVDVVFASKVSMENSQYAVSAKPSVSQVHAIECDPSLSNNKLWFVRDSTAGSGTADARLYDVGNFQIASQGLPGSTGAVLGELWVTYDISLYKPEIASPSGSQVQHIVSTTNVTKSNLFGDAPVSTGGLIAVPTVNTLTFNNIGVYIYTATMNGTVWDIPTMTGTATSTLVGFAGPRPGTITNITLTMLITTTQPGQTAIFNWASTSTITTCLSNLTPGTALFT